MTIKHIFGIGLMALAATAWGQANGGMELTVDDAVHLALEKNLSLKRSAIELGGTKRQTDRAWSGLIPSVSAGAQLSHPTSVTSEIPEARDVWTPGLQAQAALSLSASIVDKIKQARADYEAGLINYEQAKQDLELRVRKLFYQIILLDANRKLAAQSLENARARHEQSAALSRAGQAPHLDELSARVDMENKKPALLNAEMAYYNALDSFKTILDIPANQTIIPRGSLDSALAGTPDGGTPDGGAPEGAGAKKQSAAESFETESILKSIKSLKAQRSAARSAAYLPNLKLAWNSAPLYTNDALSNTKSWRDDSGSFSISLALSLDSFLPWSATKTQIDALSDSIGTAQIRLSEAQRNREDRISQLERTVEKTGETIKALRLNVELAESAYSLYKDAYQKGSADYQQLRDSADSLQQAQNQVQQEQYNLISAVLDFEKELNVPFGSLSGTSKN